MVEALRRLDRNFDVLWNPKAITVVKSTYDVLGGRTDATYDGRWQVILRDAPHSLHKERREGDNKYVVILTVCERTWAQTKNGKRYPMVLDEGPYAPLGLWVVEYIELYDRARAAAREMMADLWERNDTIDAPDHDDAAHQDALEKVYREHGGEYWMGGGQGRVHPETARTLYGPRGDAIPPAPSLSSTP